MTFIMLFVFISVVFAVFIDSAISQNLIQHRQPKTSNNAYADWYYNKWCGHGDLQYLDDMYCAKVFPSLPPDRDWICPMSYKQDIISLSELGYSIDMPLSKVSVDTETLGSLLSDADDIHACIILTKRVQMQDDTKLFNKYYCLEDKSVSEAVETWSSSKIFAMANAAGRLRDNETSCTVEEFGLNGITTGKHSATPLGDLATIICSYDTTAGYSSNSLSSYFHDLGWRDRIHDLVTSDWLGLPNHTLGGNYGEATPSDLGYTITSGSDAADTCASDKDPWPTIYSNSLSSLAAAEMARRIVMHQHIDADLRFPGMDLIDAKQILMGETTSVLFPGQAWGGMSADTAIFVQSGLNMTDVEARSSGSWRIYSKLGAGYSSSRSKGEIVTTAYACLPATSLSIAGVEVGDGGVEFTISVRGSVSYDSSLKQVQAKVSTAVQTIVAAVMSGSLK